MANVNKVILIWNLTRDPELRYTPSGTAVLDFGMAINRKWKGKDGTPQEEVGFFDCTAWARTAEIISEHVKKGNPLLVEGYLKQDRWEDKDSGQKRSKIKVTVERMQFLGSRPGAADAQPAEEAAATPPPADDQNPF